MSQPRKYTIVITDSKMTKEVQVENGEATLREALASTLLDYVTFELADNSGKPVDLDTKVKDAKADEEGKLELVLSTRPLEAGLDIFFVVKDRITIGSSLSQQEYHSKMTLSSIVRPFAKGPFALLDNAGKDVSKLTLESATSHAGKKRDLAFNLSFLKGSELQMPTSLGAMTLATQRAVICRKCGKFSSNKDVFKCTQCGSFFCDVDAVSAKVENECPHCKAALLGRYVIAEKA